MGTMPAEVGKEVVEKTVLAISGLQSQAFSGTSNPASIYRMMVSNLPSVLIYYREVEEKDTCIASSLFVRRALVLARDWNISCADENDERAKMFKDEAAAFLRSIPSFRFILEELLDASGYGYSVAEIYWKNYGDRIGVEKIIGRPQEFFDFRESVSDVPIGDLRYLPNMVPPGEAVPPEKFLVSTYKPRHGDRRGLPLLRRLYWPSWFKRNGIRLLLQFLERGQGTVAVTYASGNNDDEKEKAQEAAQAIAEEIAVAVPSSLKLIESLLSNTRHHDGNDYRSLVDYFDAEITRMILGQTLSTRGSEQNVGTQALGNVHRDLLTEIIRQDSDALSDVINEQLLGPWGKWTFGPDFEDRSFRPHFYIDTSNEKNIREEALALKEARGLVDISRADAYERLGLREPEEDEAVVNSSMIPIELTGMQS